MAVTSSFESSQVIHGLLRQVDAELERPLLPTNIAAVTLKTLAPFHSNSPIGTIETLPYQRRITANLTYSDRPTIPMERANHMKVAGLIYGEEVCSAMVRTSYWVIPRPFAHRAIKNEAKRQQSILADRAWKMLTS